MKNTTIQPTPGGWNYPNFGATNSSGFTAQPGGQRYDFGGFNGITYAGIWWSSTVLSGSFGGNYSLYSDYSYVIRSFIDRTYGFSVRCLKD
jgi:uncharacterized protein (TIGR02145 family)